MPRRVSVAINGTAAGATMDVWNAWLTGMRPACSPTAVNASMAAVTAAVAPPMTAWLVELMLATTT